MPLYLTFSFAFLGFTCIAAARVVLSLFALELGAQPFAVGLLVAMFYACPLLLSWPIGALSDRVTPRWPLLFGAVCGACGMAVPYFSHTMGALFFAAFMSGLALAILHVLAQNLVGLMSKPAERARNFSNFSMIGASTNFVGPMIAGLAIDHTSHATAALFVVAIWLAAGVLILARGKLLPASKRYSGPPTHILDTLANRRIWRTLATSSLAQLGTDLFQFYLPIHGHASGLSATAIGAVLSAFAIASFAVRSVLTRLIAKFGEERLLAYSFYVGAAAFALVPFCHSALPLALVSFIFGIGMGCGQPVTLMLMFSHSLQGRTGETLGLRLTVNNLMRVLGPAVFGSVGSALGLFAVFWINALVMGAGGVLALPKKNTPRAP
ncbi:MAG: MFS transporter [Burkholderiales bacterium]